MLLDASWRDDDRAARGGNGREAFDAAKFGRENFAPEGRPGAREAGGAS